MSFNLGKYRKIYGGPSYIRDTHQVQQVPPPKEQPIEEKIQPKEEIKQEENESIQHEQVVQKPVSKRGRPKRK